MKFNTLEWWSPSVGRNMDLKVFGKSGTPVILLNNTDEPEISLMNALSFQLKNEHNQIFCLTLGNDEVLNNQNIQPDIRLIKNNQLECYLIDEVVPRIHQENTNSFVILAGLGLGAYYAANFAFKHPDHFRKLIAISGKYDIRSFFQPFYNEDIYYNNPMDYLPNLTEKRFLNSIVKMDIRFAVGNEDPNLEETYRICNILQQKSISYQLDIWNENDPNVDNHWGEALLRHVV